MELKDYLTEVVAPKIQGDGGWLDVLALDGDAVPMFSVMIASLQA